MQKQSLRGIAVAALLVTAGCGDDEDRPTGPTFSDPLAVEPTAGSWNTWVLSSGSALRPAAPPSPTSQTTEQELAELRDLAAARTGEVTASIDYWNGGNVRRWNELHRELIKSLRPNPPRASRGLALVSVAMYDAMVASWDAKYTYMRARPFQLENGPSVYGPEPKSPSYVSERAAIAAAASDVLKSLFADSTDAIDATFEEAMSVDLSAGVHFRSDVEAGEALGHAVAALVLERARNDQADAVYNGTRLEGDGYWVPTPRQAGPPIENPLEPACGQWKPWILANGQELRPPTPPPFGGPEFTSQVGEVIAVNEGLAANPDRLQIALFWADGPGTLTPPGHWNQIAVDLAVEKGMNEPRTARMLALLGVAQADAFIACWDAKFFYWCVRPVTEVRKRPGYEEWLPPIDTPPFPSYPSGHSTTSGAASTLLSFLFPEEGVTLQSMGVEAMNSRLYGGIHFNFDDFVGFNMGSALGTRAIAFALADGCPAN